MQPKEFAIDIAHQAGKIIRSNFTLGMKKQWKADGTPLTESDTAINQLVVEGVKKYFPDHGLIAEEGGNFNETAEYVWLCDPIDGTIPFSHGLPTCVFSLALVKNGEPILGVIYDSFIDRLFFAEKNKGTTMNNQKVKVSEHASVNQGLVGLNSWPSAMYDFVTLFKTISDQGAKVINCGSIVYPGMLVASGDVIANVWPGSTPWDIAALKVIVEEAGGKVTDIFGNEQKYNGPIKGALITNGLLHEPMLALLKSANLIDKS
ncbi:MAG: inositol monophosphatase [Patescibacteria group bacterium]|jgi:fructose-1,6-bisphosphatase/inositol monophosphatase family enzyme